MIKPEVAARAIVFAAHHNRREIYVGFPTLQTIIGQKLAPEILDHYLAKTGYEGQQTEEPEDPSRPHNLWGPVPGDQGAHGSFGDHAKDSSPELWISMNKGWLAAGGLTLLIGAGLVKWLK